MQAVRPGGYLGPLGLILPSLPQGKTPPKIGNTDGATLASGAPSAGGADSFDATDSSSSVHSAANLSRLSARAEAIGAGALWACDHLYWAGPITECLTAVTVAATATRRVPIGSCVLQLPLRSAAVVAKQATALQLVSGGRFVLGIGVGSHEAEYREAGIDFAGRGRTADRELQELRRIWRGTPRENASRYRQLPASPPVPVWVGGASRAALDRAAKYGDGWIPMFLDPEAYRARLATLHDLLARQGREPDSLVPAAVVFVRTIEGQSSAGSEKPSDEARPHEDGGRWLASLYQLPAKAFHRHLIAGPAEQCAAELLRYLKAGAEHVAVMVADDDALPHFAAVVGALDRLRRTPPNPGRLEPRQQHEMVGAR